MRVRELLEPLGCTAGKTVVDDYLREVRPLFARPARTFQRTLYRPGEVCQFDVWQPREPVAVGHGQTRQGWVVVACLGYSRAGAGMLVFSKETEDLLAGIAGCLTRLGALPKELVWDRQAGIHGHGGRPTDAFAAFCGQLRVAWRFCRARGPAGQGRGRAAAGLCGDELRAGATIRQPARLPRPARRLVSQGQRAHAQDAARPAGGQAGPGASGDAPAPTETPDTAGGGQEAGASPAPPLTRVALQSPQDRG